MRTTAPLVLLAAFLLAACSKPVVPPEYSMTLSTREIMKRVIDPAATALWDKAGTIETLSGTIHKTPTTNEGWAAAAREAGTLAEGGAMLLLPGRVRKLNPKDKDWSRYAGKLVSLASRERDAVTARDGDKMFRIGGRIYEEACTACHTRYLIPFLPKEQA